MPEVTFDAFLRVVGAGVGAEDERPVAGLGEQQFASGLLKCARSESVWLRGFLHQFGHALLGDLLVRINPLVLLIKPHAPIAFLAPTGRARGGNLVSGM